MFIVYLEKIKFSIILPNFKKHGFFSYRENSLKYCKMPMAIAP